MAEIMKDTIDAGKAKIIKFYPVTNSGSVIPDNKRKTNKTKEQMQQENKNRAVKLFVLKALNNFDENDFIITCEYLPQFAPETDEQFKRDIQNYIKRVKYRMNKKGLDATKLKYHFAISCSTFQSGYKKGEPRYHFHGFIKAEGMTAEELRSLWKYGIMGRIDRFKPEMYGPEGWALYCAQQATSTGHRYMSSLNCKLPIPKEKKKAYISRRRLTELAEKKIDDKEFWEKKYPGYSFVRMEACFNEISCQYYITVVMYKFESRSTYYDRQRKQAKANLSFAHIRSGVY